MLGHNRNIEFLKIKQVISFILFYKSIILILFVYIFDAVLYFDELYIISILDF